MSNTGAERPLVSQYPKHGTSGKKVKETDMKKEKRTGYPPAREKTGHHPSFFSSFSAYSIPRADAM